MNPQVQIGGNRPKEDDVKWLARMRLRVIEEDFQMIKGLLRNLRVGTLQKKEFQKAVYGIRKREYNQRHYYRSIVSKYGADMKNKMENVKKRLIPADFYEWFELYTKQNKIENGAEYVKRKLRELSAKNRSVRYREWRTKVTSNLIISRLYTRYTSIKTGVERNQFLKDPNNSIIIPLVKEFNSINEQRKTEKKREHEQKRQQYRIQQQQRQRQRQQQQLQQQQQQHQRNLMIQHQQHPSRIPQNQIVPPPPPPSSSSLQQQPKSHHQVHHQVHQHVNQQQPSSSTSSTGMNQPPLVQFPSFPDNRELMMGGERIITNSQQQQQQPQPPPQQQMMSININNNLDTSILPLPVQPVQPPPPPPPPPPRNNNINNNMTSPTSQTTLTPQTILTPPPQTILPPPPPPPLMNQIQPKNIVLGPAIEEEEEVKKKIQQQQQQKQQQQKQQQQKQQEENNNNSNNQKQGTPITNITSKKRKERPGEEVSSGTTTTTTTIPPNSTTTSSLQPPRKKRKVVSDLELINKEVFYNRIQGIMRKHNMKIENKKVLSLVNAQMTRRMGNLVKQLARVGSYRGSSSKIQKRIREGQTGSWRTVSVTGHHNEKQWEENNKGRAILKSEKRIDEKKRREEEEQQRNNNNNNNQDKEKMKEKEEKMRSRMKNKVALGLLGKKNLLDFDSNNNDHNNEEEMSRSERRRREVMEKNFLEREYGMGRSVTSFVMEKLDVKQNPNIFYKSLYFQRMKDDKDYNSRN